MRKIRINNDIDITLTVKRDGALVQLEGNDIKLTLKNSLKKIELPFTVQGSNVRALFPAMQQKYTGVYSITLQLTDSEGHVGTTDVCNAFELVPCSCKAGGSDEPNIETVSFSYGMDLITDVGGDTSSGGTWDYLKLDNKPSINNKVLQGNVSLSDIGAIPEGGLKTVGGESLEGEGDIPLPDTSGLLSKDDAEKSYQHKGEYVLTTELAEALARYVEKVSGKGLSTNDFTTMLKLKLEGLQNYDDAAVYQAISTVNGRIDTLIGKSASEAIDTFHEIEQFLQGITDTQTLTGLLNDLKTEITTLIPTKVSELNNDSNYLSSNTGLTNVETLTLAEYEALSVKDENTIYFIKDESSQASSIGGESV